jgi:hypothetical protein
MIKIILFYVILSILLIYLFVNLLRIKNKQENKQEKHKLWLYWEGDQPDYIKMCIETNYKYNNNSFDIIMLNNNNIYDYLPELLDNNKINNNLNKLSIPQKVDYYRILLLYKYGGLYMDCDILVLKNLKEITDKLLDYDYVGFGQTGNKVDLNKSGYKYPSNWIMASRPKGILVSKCLVNLNNKLNSDIINKSDNGMSNGYHDYGKMILWEELQKLNNYKYYHYLSRLDGTRDKNGLWVTTYRLFNKEEIEYLDEDKLLFIVLYNSEANEYKKLTREEILNNNYAITKYYKKSLIKI